MKLIPVIYYGFTAMDRRFSTPMLPWVVSEIRKREYSEQLSIGIEDGIVQAYNPDFELQFSHKLSQITRFSQADQDPTTFLYLMRDDPDTLLYCYLFQAKKTSDVSDLYRQMKEQCHQQPTRSVSSAANLTSLCVDISPSSSNFFEVLYIGKIKVWQKKVPDTFVDDALEKFKAHTLAKQQTPKTLGDIGRLKTDLNLKRPEPRTVPPPLQRSVSTMSGLTHQQPITDPRIIDVDGHNRTMVLQVDRTDLRLISPDRKVILLHKHDTDVATCVQGVHCADHFGFICRETGQIHIGYLFKCESVSVANDAVSAITQAFLGNEPKLCRTPIVSCEHCPMVWYHRLCQEIEHLSDRKTQAAIMRRIEQLDVDEQDVIMIKYKGVETDSIREQNEFLMMLLRAHCEMKQGRHVHDTAENRSEFLNQYLGGGGTIFMKAKRSLTNSLEMLKRKASKDDFGAVLKDLNGQKETSPLTPIDNSDAESEGTCSRSSITSCQTDDQTPITDPSKSPDRTTPKSPMMDIFMKIGSTPKTPTEENSTLKPETGTWRQALFKRVITPNKDEQNHPAHNPAQKRTPEELRILWKKSIYQAILLVRMEKENARLKAEQEESAVKRIKLEYDEMRPNQREVMEVWELVTNKDLKYKCDRQMLLQAIRQGIPRGKRGEVWQLLAEQYSLKIAPFESSHFPNYDVPYEILLKQLTAHQHAILIDLGRTFPQHSYFSSPLGPGQLALFNLLKAYSLLDPEMGYCQGMSFIAGVLLLHMEEGQAFGLLKHLMFRRGLRRQYLPDMTGLQIRLYQLSRLLHDQLPDLYDHFDQHDVPPTLYAAPWLLTIFASQFPLGFVTRVFDLIFLEGPDVVFRVAIALLSHHKEKLLKCENFEEIMDYIKTRLPTIDKSMLDNIIKQIYTTDIAKQLNEYHVEYQVLQEEMAAVQPQINEINLLKSKNFELNEQKIILNKQLDIALTNIQRLERTRTLQQAQLNRLEINNRSLNVTILTLGNFINQLIDNNIDIDITDDVRRILNQINIENRINKQNVDDKNFLKFLQINPGKPMYKSLSTGKICLNNINNNNQNNNNVLRSNSLSLQSKISPFFSNSHHLILHEKLHSNSNINNNSNSSNSNSNSSNNSKLDIKLNENDGKISPTNSIDSGVETPSSPRQSEHPLSNCDVNFRYETKELRHVGGCRGVKSLQN